MRIVSLVPSVTETLLSWGIRPVAVTRFCDAPGLPTVGGTKNPDIDAIVALAPDVVVMDEEENREPDADALGDRGIDVFATRVRSIRSAAEATAALAARADAPRPPPEQARPAPEPRAKVWVPIWRRPWMTVGRDTYGTDILAAAGLVNVFGDSDAPYPTVDLDEVISRKPDLVLAPSEPYEFKPRHLAELSRAGPVTFVDGRDLFWWGARTPAALQRLADMF